MNADDTRRYASKSTIEALDAIMPKFRSTRQFVATLDPERFNYNAVISAISNAYTHKPMSLTTENTLRSALGIELLPLTDERPVCPIHGVVHDTKCDGEQGAAVWVHPKEKLIKAPGFGRTRKERHTIEITNESVYAELLRWKSVIGGDWNQAVRAALWLAQGGRHDVDSVL